MMNLLSLSLHASIGPSDQISASSNQTWIYLQEWIREASSASVGEKDQDRELNLKYEKTPLVLEEDGKGGLGELKAGQRAEENEKDIIKERRGFKEERRRDRRDIKAGRSGSVEFVHPKLKEFCSNDKSKFKILVNIFVNFH